MASRSGAAHLTLSDPGRVTGGLLVRQNYTEEHIGMTKATALASRLRSIRDDIRIDIATPPPNPALLAAADEADLIIDATVSITVGRFLDLLAQRPHRKAVLAQLATDSLTASLGILTLAAPGTPTPSLPSTTPLAGTSSTTRIWRRTTHSGTNPSLATNSAPPEAAPLPPSTAPPPT